MTTSNGRIAAKQHVLVGPLNRNEQQTGICFEFPNNAKIDFLLTYQCNAACAHCITDSSSSRTEWLQGRDVCDLLSTGVRFGKRYVSFTGGEPFLRYNLLKHLITHAKGLGYFVAADTNAFWGHSYEIALERVYELKSIGLNALFPSADAYHQPFVTLDRVVNVVTACETAGLFCEVNFCPSPFREADDNIIKTLSLDVRGFFSDGLSLTGRDVEALKPAFIARRADELVDTGSMHMGVSPRADCYANVDLSYTCSEFHGTPLELGNLHKDGAATVLERERSPIIAMMQVISPQRAHCVLLNDKETGATYAQSYSLRTFFSATEYWLTLFADRLWPAASQTLIKTFGTSSV